MAEIVVSFAIIAQNEADVIRNTLENVKVFADQHPDQVEIVVIDGGSTDETVSICKEFTDNVHFRKFDGDFAAQRNFANTKCNGR